jgi:hypothetical protein
MRKQSYNVVLRLSKEQAQALLRFFDQKKTDWDFHGRDPSLTMEEASDILLVADKLRLTLLRQSVKRIFSGKG